MERLPTLGTMSKMFEMLKVSKIADLPAILCKLDRLNAA